MIGAATGAVGVTVVRVHIRRTGEFRGRGVGDAVGVGPVGQNAEVIGDTVLCGQEHRVVVRSGSGVQIGDGAVRRPRGRIQNGEQTARGRVGGACAGAVSGGRQTVLSRRACAGNID